MIKKITQTYNIGVVYFKKKSYKIALECFQNGARQGDSGALNGLGILYFYGYGVKQDYIKAKEYYEKSAEQGNSDALNNLGILYLV